MNIKVNDYIAFSAGFFTLTGTVVSLDEDMLQVKCEGGRVQPVSVSKVVHVAAYPPRW